MKHTCITGEKQNVGMGSKSLSCVWLGLFAGFYRTAQSCSSSRLLLLKAEQFSGGRICVHCKIFSVLL